MVVTGFELVGLIGTIVTIVDLTKKTATLIQNYRKYDEETERLCLHFNTDVAILARYADVLETLKSQNDVFTTNEAELFVQLQADLEKLKVVLTEKLLKLSKEHGHKILSKSAWALWRKDSLEGLESQLRDWISTLAMVHTSIEADRTARKHSLPGKDNSEERMIGLMSRYQDLSTRKHVSDLTIQLSRLEVLGDSSRRMPARLKSTFNAEDITPVLVEYMAKAFSDNLNEQEVQRISDATAALAKVLYHSNPRQTGILASYGYFKDPTSHRFGLVYSLPPENLMWSSDPKTNKDRILSLRELLNVTPRFPLDEKLRFCCDLAKAVLYVHSVGWVHKSIRPDNVIFLQARSLDASEQFPYRLARPYLAGFEYARSVAEGQYSDKKSDAEWRHNVYRHPNRQGLERNEEYNMAHDIYSLGVVLLEIGLWGLRGFVPFQHESSQAKFFGKMETQRKKDLLVYATQGIDDGKGNHYPLATNMGSRFARLVEWCLNVNEQEEVPSVKFVQKVWMKLDEMRCAMAGSG